MVLKKRIGIQGKYKRKQIGIGVKELNGINEVMIYTLQEHNEVNATIDALKKEVATIKQQLEDVNADNEVIESNKQKDIDDAITTIKTEYESSLKDKDKTINQQQNIIQKKDEIIANLQQQVKRYEDKSIEVADIIATHNENTIKKYKEHNDEINQLITNHTDRINKLTNEKNHIQQKYNALRDAIINKSRWSFLFGAKKDILNQYQEIILTGTKVIDTTVNEDNNEPNNN